MTFFIEGRKLQLSFCWLFSIGLFHLHSEALPAQRPPQNLTVAKQLVKNYYETGAFNEELEAVIQESILRFLPVRPSDNKAVIFDVDDTALDYYEFMKMIDFGFQQNLFHAWVLQADAQPLRPVKKLYDHLLASGYKIIFLSNRKHDELDATIENLRKAGYTTFEKVIVRPDESGTLNPFIFKEEERKKLVRAGYTIAGTVGDQELDLMGAYTGIRVKIPNYLYRIDPFMIETNGWRDFSSA